MGDSVCKGTETSPALYIQHRGREYLCPSNGATVAVDDGTIKGELTCPSNIHKFCERKFNACPNDCLGRGRCMSNRQCLCYAGYSGADCGHKVTITHRSQWNTSQEYESIKSGTCHGEGTYMSSMGACY